MTLITSKSFSILRLQINLIIMFNKNMLNKIQELKLKAEESKSRLDNLIVSETDETNIVHLEMNGNRKLTRFDIKSDISNLNKEELENLIFISFNRLLEKVNAINEKEVMSSAQSILPVI